MTLNISNSRNFSGSTVNGAWTVLATPSSSTIFTASSASVNSGNGIYGDIQIYGSSASMSKTANSYAAIIGPTVSSDVLKVFMEDFTYNLKKRYALTDIVDVNINFVEI